MRAALKIIEFEVEMWTEVEIGGRYENIKTGKVYIVLYNALASWDAYQHLVVYQRADKDAGSTVWVRSLTEFYEKFKLLD
jgi:hypothetical protein